MFIDRARIMELLNIEEPDYDAAVEFGDEVVPYLIDIVQSEAPLLAQKATAFAARIRSDQSVRVIRAAAQSDEPAVRVAAAAALGEMAPFIQHSDAIAPDTTLPLDDVLDALLADEDEGVRRFAEQSAEARKDATLVIDDLEI